MGTKGFDKNLSAVMILQKFLTDYSDGKDITETFEYFISKLSDDEKHKPENLRELSREVKGRKPFDTINVSYADEYANIKEEKSKKKEKQEVEQIPINNQRLDDSYAMQLANDISSYRYGKHMTGFVNP